MSYSEKQVIAVNNVIDKYISSIFARVKCKNIIGYEMKNNKKPIEIADAVQDYISTNFSGNNLSDILNMDKPNNINIRNMRNDIIKALL